MSTRAEVLREVADRARELGAGDLFRRWLHSELEMATRSGGADVKPTISRTIYLPRPRDVDESKRKPGHHTLESYRVSGPWVVECFNEKGKWLYTYYGKRDMSRAVAVEKAAECQRIQDDLDAKAAAKHKDNGRLAMPDGTLARKAMVKKHAH